MLKVGGEAMNGIAIGASLLFWAALIPVAWLLLTSF
jgi:hypothetical protein